VVELMKFHRDVMRHNFTKLQSGAATSLSAIINPLKPSETDAAAAANGAGAFYIKEAQEVAKIQPRWCSGEDANLFRERWEKLFKEFYDENKVDPSKISELYDTMKYDALHNRQFLEWVFTPEAHMLEEESVISETGTTSPTIEAQSKPSGFSTSSSRRTSAGEANVRDGHHHSISGTDRAAANEKGHLAQRLASLRRRPSGEEKTNGNITSRTTRQTNESQESYFTLYTGIGNNDAQASKAKIDARLRKLRELYKYCKVLFDYIGPQEYGISGDEKLEIGLLTSLPLLREIVQDLEEMQASTGAKSFFYFTKESHIYTLMNCILEGGVKTKIERKAIPELDYLSQIQFELYESQNESSDDEPESFNYSIRISISPGCHTFDPLDVMLDSKHCIGCAPRRSLTAHVEYQEILDTLKEKFAKYAFRSHALSLHLGKMARKVHAS
jgi:inositol hexakisphosphate/diphosphoinositol-pentakisphosphate kinase